MLSEVYPMLPTDVCNYIKSTCPIDSKPTPILSLLGTALDHIDFEDHKIDFVPSFNNSMLT